MSHDYTCLDSPARVDGPVQPGSNVLSDRPEVAPVCNARLDRIVPAPFGNLNGQERLTRRLLSARPRLERASGEWTEIVAREFGVPLVVGSYGPTAADKRHPAGQPAFRKPSGDLVLLPS